MAEVLGAERPTLFTDMWQYIVNQRDRQWRTRVEQIDDEILDCAAATYDLYAIDELRKAAQDKGNVGRKDRGRGRKAKLEHNSRRTGQGLDAERSTCGGNRKTIS